MESVPNVAHIADSCRYFLMEQNSFCDSLLAEWLNTQYVFLHFDYTLIVEYHHLPSVILTCLAVSIIKPESFLLWVGILLGIHLQNVH
jgi:hypothetical protein